MQGLWRGVIPSGAERSRGICCDTPLAGFICLYGWGGFLHSAQPVPSGVEGFLARSGRNDGLGFACMDTGLLRFARNDGRRLHTATVYCLLLTASAGCILLLPTDGCSLPHCRTAATAAAAPLPLPPPLLYI